SEAVRCSGSAAERRGVLLAPEWLTLSGQPQLARASSEAAVTGASSLRPVGCGCRALSYSFFFILLLLLMSICRCVAGASDALYGRAARSAGCRRRLTAAALAYSPGRVAPGCTAAP